MCYKDPEGDAGESYTAKVGVFHGGGGGRDCDVTAPLYPAEPNDFKSGRLTLSLIITSKQQAYSTLWIVPYLSYLLLITHMWETLVSHSIVARLRLY